MDIKTLLFLVTGIVSQGTSALQIYDLRVPTHAIKGQDVILECHYDLGHETLYSVKWYKDGHEFYRHVPRDNPIQLGFDPKGVKVDVYNSTKTFVILKSVQLETTGIYRCEVSGEAPSFQTVDKRAYMTVVALPEKGPVITGGQRRYHVGDTVRVNCTSYRSKPAARLNWLINGEQADSQYLRGPDISTNDTDGLETTVLGLEFTAKHRHFRKGNMKLKCLSTISTVYLVSNEESMEGEKPLKGKVMESRGTHSTQTPPPNSNADRIQSDATRLSIASSISTTSNVLLWIALLSIM